MAQQVDNQPGNINADEGKDNEEERAYTLYGVYRCYFENINNSLLIEMKNTKSKRLFKNIFDKKYLINQNLKQSINKIISMLNAAKSGKISELKFSFGFGVDSKDQVVDVDNDDDDDCIDDNNNILQVMSTPKLSKIYQKGDSMYISVLIEKKFFDPEQYIFKLIEQKREETDILHDIIEDMQQEINKLKNNQTGYAVWRVSKQPASASIELDIESVTPTINGMAVLSGDKKNIIIGIDGSYRITVVFNYNAYNIGCTTDLFSIQLNGANICQKYSGTSSGYGTIEETLNLKKDDKLSFTVNCCHATTSQFNSFTLQKL